MDSLIIEFCLNVFFFHDDGVCSCDFLRFFLIVSVYVISCIYVYVINLGFRDDKLFNKKLTSPSKTADCIITTVFNWVLNRGSFGAC